MRWNDGQAEKKNVTVKLTIIVKQKLKNFFTECNIVIILFILAHYRRTS